MTVSTQTIRPFLLATAASLATAAMLVPAGPARADDCLLDTTGDGFATATGAAATSDTDGGANSSNIDLRLACGFGAQATGGGSTAVGYSATASGSSSVALGYEAEASQFGAIAVGHQPRPTTHTQSQLVKARMSEGPDL